MWVTHFFQKSMAVLLGEKGVMSHGWKSGKVCFLPITSRRKVSSSMDGSYITMRVFGNWPSWIGLRWFFYYHGKSPLNHHLGNMLANFPSILCKSKPSNGIHGIKMNENSFLTGQSLLGHCFGSDPRSRQHFWNSDTYQLLPHSWTCRQVRHIAQKMSSTNAHPHIYQRVTVFFWNMWTEL